MSYCGNCGTQIGEMQSFCAGCGARVSATAPSAQSFAEVTNNASVAAEQSSEAALRKLAMLNPQTQPPSKSSRNKILNVTLAIVLAGTIAVVIGVVYVGYRVKQKSTAALDNIESKSRTHKLTREPDSGDANKSESAHKDDTPLGGGSDNPFAAVLDKLQGDGGNSSMGNLGKSIFEDLGAKNPDMPPDLIRNIPYSALSNPLPCPTGGQIDPSKLASGRILFKPGTVLTSSWSLPLADAESDNIIRSVSPSSLVFEYNGVAALGLDMKYKSRPDFNETVCAKDIAQGEAYATGWTAKSLEEPITPGLYPGVARLLVPATKFNQLKSSGSTELVFALYDYMDALTEWELLAWKGIFTRVEPNDVPFPLIINDERVTVPAIHLRASMKVIETAGRFGPRDQPLEAYILDDANTPVMLSWMMGKDMHQDDSFKVELVRVTYPRDKPTIEQQLAKNRKAITWGINFEFNSAAIRPVSEPVLQEIAQAMVNKQDWKLTITGHTDNIGGHKYNLELSQRRSAAVKKALVDRYHVDPNRLSTGGDGDSVPIDTNDTLEGRARNRRVELTLD